MPTLKEPHECVVLFFVFPAFRKRFGKGKITDCQAVHELAKNIKKYY
jgi:hypothetical protein